MEAILFIGLPASGKSTYYKTYFFNSHIRVSRDLLNTKNKEDLLMDYCFRTQSRFVIDNTNVEMLTRLNYIHKIKKHKYKIIGYFFDTPLKNCLIYNEARIDKIPKIGLLSKYKALEVPLLNEGFDELYVLVQNNDFNYTKKQIL